MNFASERNRDRYRAVVLFVVFLALLASRRWDQWASPQVWAEESFVIKGFIENGWREVFLPIHGYLLLVPKLILGVSMKISLIHLPAIATVLTWVLTALIGVAIAMSPTRLKGKVVCALATFAVPSDPEVFGIPLYTFWWTSLLLFLLAVWDEQKPALGRRILFLLAGGLSSPVIVAVLPVLYFRAWWFRKVRAELWLTLAATPIAAAQLYFSSQFQAPQLPSLSSIATHVIPKFSGAFLIGNLSDSRTWAWVFGLAVLGVLVAGAIRDRRNVIAWTLLVLLVAAVAMTIARQDPAIPHHRLAGPRYFFYPFVIMFWAAVQCIHRPQPVLLRGLAGAMLVLAFVNSWRTWVRGIEHYDLRWADHLRSAALFSEYAIPTHLDGSRHHPWRVLRVSGAVWAGLIQEGQLFPAEVEKGLPTFAYRVLEFAEAGAGTVPEGRDPMVPAVSPATGRQELDLQLNRGDRFRFRTGAGASPARMSVVGLEERFIEELPVSSAWITLEFSNANLPATFTLKIEDTGSGVGEWAPVESSR